jgi:hypothetical protein
MPTTEEIRTDADTNAVCSDLEWLIVPTSPTTHFDKINDDPFDDLRYIYSFSGQPSIRDCYTLEDVAGFDGATQRVSRVRIVVRWRGVLLITASDFISRFTVYDGTTQIAQWTTNEGTIPLPETRTYAWRTMGTPLTDVTDLNFSVEDISGEAFISLLGSISDIYVELEIEDLLLSTITDTIAPPYRLCKEIDSVTKTEKMIPSYLSTPKAIVSVGLTSKGIDAYTATEKGIVAATCTEKTIATIETRSSSSTTSSEWT